MRIFVKTTIILTALATMMNANAKRTLDHDSFDSWERVTDHSLSPDGAWAAFSVNPQEGDGNLYIRATDSKREIRVERGYEPIFTADSRRLIAKIKPMYHFFKA